MAQDTTPTSAAPISHGHVNCGQVIMMMPSKRRLGSTNTTILCNLSAPYLLKICHHKKRRQQQ